MVHSVSSNITHSILIREKVTGLGLSPKLGGIKEYSIGICASDRPVDLDNLLESLENEQTDPKFALKKIIVMASGCETGLLDAVRKRRLYDERVSLIEEQVRRGKADAINRIIENAEGEYLIFVNGDARPERGSVSMLLEALDQDSDTGLISGCPTFRSFGGMTSMLLELMWAVHNECSRELNELHLSNHSSDELMAVRKSVLKKLPQGLINDGAFLAGTARLEGYSIRFCERAKVRIDVPVRLRDVLEQRRRITYGHFQVWNLTGSPPRTLESLLFFSPRLCFKILGSVLRRRPKLILVLPFAAIEEAISAFLAITDRIISTNRHRVWKRYGS